MSDPELPNDMDEALEQATPDGDHELVELEEDSGRSFRWDDP